jgi:hypothetical protein
VRGKERKYQEEQGGKAGHDGTRTSVEVERTLLEKEGKCWQPKTTKKKLKVESRRWGAYGDKTATFIAAWVMT